MNDYLREFRTKLSARKAHHETLSESESATAMEKTRALKEIETIKKMTRQLDNWEGDVLFSLAGEQVPLDLDDGVKVNYPKLGRALKKIPGLS
ncbi:MAG: hypothetical protein GY950_15015 [bacterium]|nr:hypothetical protein [bacterium]